MPIEGLVTVKDPRKLDYETTVRLKVVVIAESGLSCDFAILWVHLRDVNDNSPQFTRDKYFSAVYEDMPKGSYVTQVGKQVMIELIEHLKLVNFWIKR